MISADDPISSHLLGLPAAPRRLGGPARLSLATMGQGEDDLATTPSSSPLWITHITHGRVADPDESMGCQQGGEHGVCSDGKSDIGDGEDHAEINKTFLDTETLCSFSSFHPFNSPRTQHSPSCFHPTSFASDSFSLTTSTGTGTGGQLPTEDFGDDSFLLSRQTSAATMAFSTPGSATMGMEATNSAHPAPIFSHFHRQRQEPDVVELRLPAEFKQNEQEAGSGGLSKPHDDLGLFHDLDYDHLFPETFTNHLLLFQHRPSSSRSHLRSYQRTRSPLPNASRYLRVSSDGPSPAMASFPSRPMTREEFEALPPTIQRKYFSTLERLRFVSPDSIEDFIPRSAGTDQPSSRPSTAVKPPKRRRRHKNRVASEASASSSQTRTRVSSIDQRFYANLPDKIKRRHLTEEEQLFAHYHRQSVLSGSADGSLQKPEDSKLEGLIFESPLASPGLSEGQTETSSMHSRQGIKTSHGPVNKRTDSFYDSFRWLEEDDELDLRLYLDDYHINLREEIPLPNNKSRRPSFRRHLSINKLPFGRPSLSYSRPGTQDAGSSPAFTPPSQSPVMGYPAQGHVRRKSRALSLISPNRQPAPSSVTAVDPAATHYQDPETRMKLRLYLASPQKFDEAIEFGFPSVDDGMQQEDQMMGKLGGVHRQKSQGVGKLRTFLADDRSSTCSDDASMADPESPKTPELFEKPTPPRPVRMSTERTVSRGEYGHAPSASREMTVRMTLTRPDLRSHEDEIYGWKQAGGRSLHSRSESASGPTIFARDAHRKESIERQLAALDECEDDAPNENGVVKRIWNRVRRS